MSRLECFTVSLDGLKCSCYIAYQHYAQHLCPRFTKDTRAFLLKIRQKPIHSRLCHLFLVIFGGQCDSEAQLFEPPDGPTLGRLGGLFVGMTRPQFAIRLLFLEQVIDDDQDPVCQCHDGFLATHALFESLVVGPQVGVLAACGPVGSLDEGLLQPTIALTRLGAQPFASADLGLRTESCPADHVPLAGELVELDAQFRYDDLGNALVDPRDLIQDAYHLSLAACWVRWRPGRP